MRFSFRPPNVGVSCNALKDDSCQDNLPTVDTLEYCDQYRSPLPGSKCGLPSCNATAAGDGCSECLKCAYWGSIEADNLLDKSILITTHSRTVAQTRNECSFEPVKGEVERGQKGFWKQTGYAMRVPICCDLLHCRFKLYRQASHFVFKQYDATEYPRSPFSPGERCERIWENDGASEHFLAGIEQFSLSKQCLPAASVSLPHGPMGVIFGSSWRDVHSYTVAFDFNRMLDHQIFTPLFTRSSRDMTGCVLPTSHFFWLI